ncbi:cupin-like domain-containing protein [Niabella aquatica]
MKLKAVNRITGAEAAFFVKNFMKRSTPVILKDFIHEESPALKKWDYSYFKELAGDIVVNVYGGEIENLDRVASKPVGKMEFAVYLDMISSQPTENRLFLFDLLKLRPELKNDLKYRDVTSGKILEWLPFMFFGGQGSVTRNHIDIDMSHVFISQFKGIKRIWLFPWEQSALLYRPPFNFHSIANLKDPDYKKFPGLKYLQGYEALLNPGETLYIPSGWWHYIQYETEGYSVSLRALPFSLLEKWRGFKNLVILRNFDNVMRKAFKEKWFKFKTKAAFKKADRAIRKLK